MTKRWKPSAAECDLIRQLKGTAPEQLPPVWTDDMRAAVAEALSPEPCGGDTPEAFANSEDALLWLAFDRANPKFYPVFSRFAREAVSYGHTRLSAWLIVNRIRWETNIVARGEGGYKISNGLIAFYARAWSNDHKQHPNFFQQKTMNIEPPNALFTARALERQQEALT